MWCENKMWFLVCFIRFIRQTYMCDMIVYKIIMRIIVKDIKTI